MPEVTATFTVAVVNEGEGWAEAEARAAQAQAAAEEAAAEEAAAEAPEEAAEG